MLHIMHCNTRVLGSEGSPINIFGTPLNRNSEFFRKPLKCHVPILCYSWIKYNKCEIKISNKN